MSDKYTKEISCRLENSEELACSIQVKNIPLANGFIVDFQSNYNKQWSILVPKTNAFGQRIFITWSKLIHANSKPNNIVIRIKLLTASGVSCMYRKCAFPSCVLTVNQVSKMLANIEPYLPLVMNIPDENTVSDSRRDALDFLGRIQIVKPAKYLDI